MNDDKPTPLALALDLVDMVVEHRNTIPILGNVLLTSDEADLVVEGTDLDIEIAITVPGGHSPMRKGFIASAGIKPVKAAVDYFGGKTTFEARDNATRLFVGETFLLPCLDPDEFPRVQPFAGETSFEIVADQLLADLRAVGTCMSTEETRYYLNGIYFHSSNEDRVLKLAATDGHRLAVVTRPWPCKVPLAGIVPRKLVKLLIAALAVEEDHGQPVRFRFGGQGRGGSVSVEISFGRTFIRAKLIDGKFPDYFRVVPTTEAGALLVDPEALRAVAKGARVIHGDGRSPVSLCFREKEVRAKSPENGVMRAPMPGTREGNPPDEIGMNGDYLDALLRIFDDQAEVRISFGDAATPIKVTANGTLVAVLKPMRL